MAKRKMNRKPEELDGGKIEAIPSTDPAARDEGPRLLPLRSSKPESMAGKKYLDLADRALNGTDPKR